MMLQFVSLIPAALIVAGVMLYARMKAYETATILLMLLAFALYYFHFYHSSWQQFSIDPEPHMEYVRFIVDTHRLPLPTDNMGAAARHPPAFYIASAALLETAHALGLANPEQFMRHLAMACYAAFIVMGIQLLRLLLKVPSMAYYSAAGLLLFWPIGATMGGRISCDILLFAGQAGALYALIRWLSDKTPEHLCAPFIWGGIAVTGKNSGAIMLGFASLALVKIIYDHRANLRALIRWDLAFAIAFAIAATGLSFWHGWILRHIEAYGYYWNYLWFMTSQFNPFLLMYDTGLGLSQDSFWNMWLHSLLLGDGSMRWNYPTIMLVIKVIWLALLFYAVEGLISARKTLSPVEKQTLLLLAAFVIMMVLAALYLLLRTANPNYADARYAYPAVIAFACVHGLVMKHHQANGHASAHRIGGMLSVTFALLTMLLFGTQYLG